MKYIKSPPAIDQQHQIQQTHIFTQAGVALAKKQKWSRVFSGITNSLSALLDVNAIHSKYFTFRIFVVA